jgi:DNA polymerase III subunit beta
MDILANRESLLPVVSRVANVVERRQTLPILGHLLLRTVDDGVTVVGTDLEVEVRGHCETRVLGGGATTVPSRKLLDIVRNLPEGSDVKLLVSGDRCVVTAGRGRYVLGTLPAADFPVIQMDSERRQFEVEEGAIKRVFEKTAFAMAQQDVRYYLNGMLLEVDSSGICAVATDGHRLARFRLDLDLELDERFSAIIPYKTVMEMRRQFGTASFPVVVRVGERTIQFVVGDTVTTSKLVDGRYPDYEKVIPVNLGKTAVIDKEGLRGALSRTAILSNEKYRGVRLSFEKGLLCLQAHNPEQEEAVEEMELEFDGEATTIGFNVSYLSDVLAALDGQFVQVRFQDGDSSSVWRAVGAENETFVVMPMRL